MGASASPSAAAAAAPGDAVTPPSASPTASAVAPPVDGGQTCLCGNRSYYFGKQFNICCIETHHISMSVLHVFWKGSAMTHGAGSGEPAAVPVEVIPTAVPMETIPTAAAGEGQFIGTLWNSPGSHKV